MGLRASLKQQSDFKYHMYYIYLHLVPKCEMKVRISMLLESLVPFLFLPKLIMERLTEWINFQF